MTDMCFKRNEEKHKPNDDYGAVVSRLLKYLYKQLKAGQPPEPEMLRHDSRLCMINEYYWEYIIVSMQEQGLIRGLVKNEDRNEYENLPDQLKNVQITPDGITLLVNTANRVNQIFKGLFKLG